MNRSFYTNAYAFNYVFYCTFYIKTGLYFDNMFCLINFIFFRLVMMDYGEFVPWALKTSTDNILKKLGNKLDLIPQIMTDPNLNYGESYQMIMNGTHAHLETFSYLKHLYSTTFKVADQVYFMKEQIYSGNLAFFFPKKTPWKHKFDEVIPRLVESGIISKWYDEEIMEGVKKVAEVSFLTFIFKFQKILIR